MVSTERPAQSSASVRQERRGSPSTSTAQAPHSPSSQPCLVPVRPRSSRSTSSSVLYGANETSSVSPLTVSPRCAFCIVWGPNKLRLLYRKSAGHAPSGLAAVPVGAWRLAAGFRRRASCFADKVRTPNLGLESLPERIVRLAPGMIYAVACDQQAVRLPLVAGALSASLRDGKRCALVTGLDPRMFLRKARLAGYQLDPHV